MKKIDKEKRNAIFLKKILAGSTWEELEQEFVLTKTYIQTCLRKHIKLKKHYDLLLAKARANAKTKAIYVAETGALLNNSGLLRGKSRVFVPEFCKKEIEKIGPENVSILNNPKICWCNITWERVKNLPSREIKHRTIGITAFCCAMAKRNNDSRVVVYTNSRDIAELIEAQQLSNVSVVKFQRF